MRAELHRAVSNAVDVVNGNSGHTWVSLRFADDPLSEIDFVANTAAMRGGQFEFQAGFDTYSGSVDELAAIKTEVINPVGVS